MRRGYSKPLQNTATNAVRYEVCFRKAPMLEEALDDGHSARDGGVDGLFQERSESP